MPARLLDRASNKWVDVRDEDVQPLVAKGTHAFEAGIRVPVVSEDGSLGDIPSEEAEAAFKEGSFRWSTPQDVTAFEDRERDRIMDDRSGGALDSGISGFNRGGTFGLSDTIVPAAAEFFGEEGDGEFAREALRRQKENHAGAAITGEIIGSIIGAPGKAIKVAKEGTSLLQAAGHLPQVAKATTTLGRIGQRAATEAAEGAVYGLGEGIGEAALGDPDEVVQNIASSVAFGGLFGGAFGSAFGAAKEIAPSAKAFVSKTAQNAEEMVQNQARNAVKKAAAKLLDKEDAKILGDLADDKEFVQLFAAVPEDMHKQLIADYQAAKKGLDAESAQLRQGFESYLKTAPKNRKRFIMEEVLPRNDGNLQRAANDLDNEILGKSETINNVLAESGEQASEGLSRAFDRTLTFAEQLKATGNSKAKNLGQNLLNSINAEKRARGLLGSAEDAFGDTVSDEARALWQAAGQGFTALEERNLLLELRSTIKGAIEGKTDPKIRKMLERYGKELDGNIYSNKMFGEGQRHIDEMRSAYDDMRKFLTSSKTVNQASQKNIKASVLRSIMIDQNQARKFNDVMLNISKFAPEMEAFRKAGNDAIAQDEALRSILSKMNATKSTRNSMGERLTTEELGTFLKALDAPEDIMSRFERLKSLEGTLQANGATPATNMLATLKAFGHPISELQEQVIAKGDQFEKLEKAFGKRHSPGVVEKLLGLAIKRPIRGLAGAAIGGIFGDTTGAIIGAAATSAVHPRFVLKNLARLDKAAQQAAERSTKATHAAIEALTSEKARKVGAAAAGVLGANASLKERRKNFRERAEFTSRMAMDPNSALEEFENRFGEMEHTPTISASMMKQFAQTAQFLESKLPKDPLAGQTLSQFHSKWQPTDFQLAQYERYVRAAEDPISVIEDIARGKVTPEAIETLKTLNPIMFKQLHDGVLDAIMKPEANLSYKQRLLIGTLFDIPADPTMMPSFINTMQATYQEQAQTGQQPATMSPQKSVHIDINPEAIATETTRISNS